MPSISKDQCEAHKNQSMVATSSSGQPEESPQQPTNVSTAKGEFRELEKKEYNLQKDIDGIKNDARTELVAGTQGFRKNPITGVISYNGSDPDWTEAYTHMAKLEDQLKNVKDRLLEVQKEITAKEQRLAVAAQQQGGGRMEELATAVQELKSRQHTIEMDHLKACFLEQGEADDVSDSTSVLSGDTPASNAEISANKKRIRELLGTKCMVCGSEKDVAVAHILKKASHCQSFMAYYDKNSKDMSNWLMLCGTRGKVNACHHLFDSYEMGFCMKDGEWYAYGGVKDGEQVALRSNPHRTVLQAHLAMVMKNLEEKKQANEAVLAWSKDVSQSTPPAQGTGSM